MENNDILIRIRYALDLKDTEVIEIFKLGGVEITKEEVKKIFHKPAEDSVKDSKVGTKKDVTLSNKPISNETISNKDISNDAIDNKNTYLMCDNVMLESFLNGFIIYKRGIKEENPENPQFLIRNSRNVNNVMMKKLKIALSLTSDDMIDILKSTGIIISNGELSAIFRKEGHRNYRECGDRYARNFLKGLAIKYRK